MDSFIFSLTKVRPVVARRLAASYVYGVWEMLYASDILEEKSIKA